MQFGPKKRQIQRELTSKLDENLYQEGIILGFMGDDPLDYIENLRGFFPNNFIHLYESNWERYKKGFKRICQFEPGSITSWAISSKNLFIAHRDLFSTNPLCNNFAGIDLDFCECLREELTAYLGIWLTQVLINSTREDIWLRITTSIGPKSSRKQILDRLDNIITFINTQTNWKQLGKFESHTYRDSRAMLVWQAQLTRREEMSKNVKKYGSRYLSDLTDQARRRVRNLLEEGMDAEQVGTRYHLCRGTVMALKAHQTRGTY